LDPPIFNPGLFQALAMLFYAFLRTSHTKPGFCHHCEQLNIGTSLPNFQHGPCSSCPDVLLCIFALPPSARPPPLGLAQHMLSTLPISTLLSLPPSHLLEPIKSSGATTGCLAMNDKCGITSRAKAAGLTKEPGSTNF